MILVDQGMARRHVAAGVWGTTPLDKILARNSAVRPDDVALVDRADRLGWQRTFPPELTWVELDRLVSSVAATFLDMGLKQDDVVAIQLGNTAETLIAHLAALRAGLIPAALPLTWRERELTAAFARISPLAIVTATRIGPNDHTDLMMRVAAGSMSVRHVLAFGEPVVDGIYPLNEALKPDASAEGGHGVPRTGNPADHVAIVTFAAWEDRIEPVARSHNQWLAAAMETVLEARIGPDAAVATTLLPSSLAGLACGLAAWLLSGCRLILVMPVTSATFCREIGRLAATHLVLPGHLTHLVARLDPERRMRLVRYWASPEAFMPTNGETRTEAAMTDVISLDEMALTAASGRAALVLPFARSLSEATDVEVRGDDDANDPKRALLSARMPGAVLRAGGQFAPGALINGPLLLGGPQMPSAPFPSRGAPVEDNFRFRSHPDGFRETGLRCRRADNGSLLAVSGYRKETFITGGVAVSAEVLDDVYRGHREFLDAAAACIPDPLFGERIVAAVVPRPGSDCSLSVFRAYLRGLGVGAHMIPDRIIAVREIPRGSDGAILRSAIATSIAA